MKVPCKDCTERVLGCHAECKKYKAYTNELKTIRLNRMNQNEKDEYFVRQAHTVKEYQRKNFIKGRK